MPPPAALFWSLVSVGILAISSASILIRLAAAPPLAIATYRVALATLFIAPYCLLRRSSPGEPLSTGTAALTLCSGGFLALHFFFWISSLHKTSVASSVVLVSTTPLFTGLFAWAALGEPLHRRLWIGIALTAAGSTALAAADLTSSHTSLQGHLLALLGAVMACGYLVAGSAVRRRLDLGSYTLATNGSAALVLIPCCLLTATPLSGFAPQTYVMLGLLAAIPQLIGHATMNWALRFLSPTQVAMLILGEPIGATLLAYLLLGESVTAVKLLGLTTVAAGITVASLPPAVNKRAPNAPRLRQ